MARPKLNKALLSLEVCLFVRGGASGGGALNTHDIEMLQEPPKCINMRQRNYELLFVLLPPFLSKSSK